MLINHLYRWACERLYAELAWSYDWVSWLVSLGQWQRWRALALAEMQGERILELGFGTGELLCAASATGRAIYGLELAPAMHGLTAQKLTQRGLATPRVQARAQAMPFADATFDTIVATFPAPYILETATLRECVRLLRPSPAGQNSASRLLIVGLWVRLRHPTLQRMMPLFYGAPGEAWLERWQAQLTAAGLTATMTERTSGFAQVSIISATLKHGADQPPATDGAGDG